MPNDFESPHQFNEKQISAILKRAVEMQETEGVAPGAGLSLAELQQLAAEAGIDPRYVATAAAELTGGGESGDQVNFWGGPLSLTLERVVEGEIDEVVWEDMVAKIRQAFKDTGKVRSWGHSMEWTHSGRSEVRAHVTVTPRDGRTSIQVFWHEPSIAAVAYVPLLVLGLIMLPVVFDTLVLPALGAVGLYGSILGVLFVLARWALIRMAGKRKRSLTQLMAELEQVAAEEISDRETPSIEMSTPVATAPPLDIEDPAPEQDETVEMRRRRTSA